MARIGIIGGSGLYALDGLSKTRELNLETPFGRPSDALVAGALGDNEVVFVPRHGRGHRLTPSEVPYRANVLALKNLGVEWLVSVSAVGSLDESIPPGTVVLPDQYIDRTAGRPSTFFGAGIVAHVSLATPTCPILQQAMAAATTAAGCALRRGGTYVCIEGPAFSTRAESNLYRSWNAQVIGMTGMPEARLAREAELHYAALALVTDYDCWKTGEEAVSADAVVATLRQNTSNVRRILSALIPEIGAIKAADIQCGCTQALSTAMLTDPTHVPTELRETLAPLLRKYLPAS